MQHYAAKAGMAYKAVFSLLIHNCEDIDPEKPKEKKRKFIEKINDKNGASLQTGVCCRLYFDWHPLTGSHCLLLTVYVGQGVKDGGGAGWAGTEIVSR